MRIVEIQEGISINTDKIEGIKANDNNTCEIFIGGKTYLSTFAYPTLLQMLRIEGMVDNGLSKSENMERAMVKLDKVLNNAQHFVG